MKCLRLKLSDLKHIGGVSFLVSAKQWARTVKRDVVALWIAARDPRIPWCAKATAGAVAAYALSPIDLIPDFIPIIGYLDDLLRVPLGIELAVRLCFGRTAVRLGLLVGLRHLRLP